MPTEDELNEMSQRIAGVDYDKIANPANRMEIMRLTLAAISANSLVDIAEAATNINTHLEQMKTATVDGWNNLDVEMTKVGDWFKQSRLFDGLS